MCVSRALSLLLLAATLAGCATTALPVKKKGPDPMHVAMYGPHPDERFPLPAMDISRVNPKYFRQQVAYQTMEPAGTIVIDTQNRFLYLVQGEGMAMRYGIGVGKAGLEFEGTARIGRKAEWPRWTPTQNMIEREPERNLKWAGGMEPGLTNPLGPRALYLHKDGKDTLFRIHGTSEPWSIGKAVSSGCVRLFNQDIIDLYSRVPAGSRVVVLQHQTPMGETTPMAANQTTPMAGGDGLVPPAAI
ncbi:UNVERIFIED_ORG: L,D-transpeptidase [Roseateles sp. XES5]|nr:L,D-transpeptidase [Roseateles sp. XES5]